MLNSLRSYATSWVSQILIGLLVISFAVWGVSDIFTGFRGDAVAQVGSTDITVIDFQRDYDLAVQNLSRQLGQPINQQQAVQMGIPGQVLGRLISQATLDEAADRFGLGLSNETLGRMIAEDPQFQGPSGTFDRNYLAQIIRARGLTEDQFIVKQRGEYTRSQIGQAFAGGIAAPTTYLRAIHEFRNEARDVSYVVIDAPPESEIADPDDSALAVWFEERKDDWRAPEYRAITYFMLTPQALARVEDVTDAEAQARYDASPQRFSTVERRRIHQVVFDSREEAEAAAAELSSGKLFDELLTARGLSMGDVDLGMVTQQQLADAAISEAAFSLPQYAVSGIVEGRFGPVIMRVVEIEPAVVTPFGDVVETLKAEIAAERAAAEVADMHDAIEDTRAGGESLMESAAKYGLTMLSVAAVDETGRDEDGNLVDGLPTGLVAGAFESDVGLENDPIQQDRNSFAWYEVTVVTQPRDRELSEVRDRVVAAWKEEQRRSLVETRAAEIEQEVSDRGDLAAVAAEHGLPVLTATGLTRTTQASGDLSLAALTAAFEAERGSAVTAAGNRPLTSLVLVVDAITVPAFDANDGALAQLRQQFDSAMVGDLMGMYVSELQSQTEVRFNQPVLQQVLGVAVN